MNLKSEKKSIYDYDDYRSYLRDHYSHSKSEKPQFSYRYFAKLAGFSSPIFIKRVIEGERNLSIDGIHKMTKALKLNRDEAQYFYHLVEFNQAKNSREKKEHAEGMLNSRGFRKIHPLKDSQYRYYSNWYFIAIRELVDLKGFREDPEWIAKALNPPISPKEAKKALEELESLGLLKRDFSGKLIQSDPIVTTTDRIISSSLASFHKEMMIKAIESIDRIPRAEREISAITTGISEKTMSKIKVMVENFRKEIAMVAAEDSDRNSIYQINFQIFPLTRLKGEEK